MQLRGMFRGMPHKDSDDSLLWLTEENVLWTHFGRHHEDFEHLPGGLFWDALIFADELVKEQNRPKGPAPGMGTRR